MKHSQILTKLTALLCLLLLALTLASCTPDADIGSNTSLSGQFMDHVMANDFDSAFGMVKATVTDTDFRPYWQTMQTAIRGAETYEMEQIGWKVNRSNGVTTRTTAYQVYLDNDRIILLRTVTRDGIEGIAGIHFSDITDFIHTTDSYIPTVRIILYVFSGLCMAFTVWMLVDCLRRKPKHKVLWAILIFLGVCLNFTVGETANFSFNVGLFFQTSSITADPGLISVVTKIVLPVGAILYLCLRKKFEVPTKPENPFAPIEQSEEGIPTEAEATDFDTPAEQTDKRDSEE
ncbi:MAG: hypothetical protein IJD38_08740 [Clostridia bacterium]|nr:hypothetical protein [Clostridia bacterium]